MNQHSYHGRLNCDVPMTHCLFRKEFLYNNEKHHGEFLACFIYQCVSMPNRCIMFNCILENGASIGRAPLHAFAWKECETQPLDHLAIWDNFSYDVVCTRPIGIHGLRMRILMKDKKVYHGEHMFTLDWYGSEYAEAPTDSGWKCAHVIKLDSGNFAAQPNNRVQFLEPSFITAPFDFDGENRPDYETMKQSWSSEGNPKWATEDSYRMFYDDQELWGVDPWKNNTLS